MATTIDRKTRASGGFTASVNKLLAVREQYPDLKAKVSFLELQKRITELESQIADRRELYNDASNLFNTRIQEMPCTVIAGTLGMKPRSVFQASGGEKSAVKRALAPHGT